jgi:Alkylmercury lyase
MLFFRSEEHLDRWLSRQRGERGAVLTLADAWRLAKAWYPDRRRSEWTPRTVEQSQQILESVGLRGEFWALRTST